MAWGVLCEAPEIQEGVVFDEWMARERLKAAEKRRKERKERSVPALSFVPGDEVLYGVSLVDDSYSLLAIDPWSGDTTTIGPLGVTPHGLAADGAGRLWLGTDTSLYRVDRGTAVSSSRIAPRIRPDPNPLRASI